MTSVRAWDEMTKSGSPIAIISGYQHRIQHQESKGVYESSRVAPSKTNLLVGRFTDMLVVHVRLHNVHPWSLHDSFIGLRYQISIRLEWSRPICTVQCRNTKQSHIEWTARRRDTGQVLIDFVASTGFYTGFQSFIFHLCELLAYSGLVASIWDAEARFIARGSFSGFNIGCCC